MENIGKRNTRQDEETKWDEKNRGVAWRTHIATLLKEYRRDHNLLQRQLGEMLFVSGETIWKYEHEKCEPGLDFLMRLARLTGSTIEEVLGLEPAADVEPGPDEKKEEFLSAVWEAHKRVFEDLLGE